ncbi:glycosyltransferase family 4 protein [Synechococcus sp. N19]|uniref:glycosyltransferase family 4 protein n=1 Tax=Synechococcus sp. N19 TaxID=2575512 RepID=UPI000E0E31C4|nr:glycosyltransferase family 4 protein [Synechococcus sp. N19]
MRILLVNHGAAGAWGGGDGVQIRETAKRLQQRGHEVVGVNADQPDCRGFDLVHLFNCRVEGSFHQQMASCKAAGVPVVVSPIWISLARALWGSRGSTLVLSQAMQQGEASAGPLLEQLRKREMVVQLEHGPVNAEGNGDCCWPLNRERLRQLLREADGLLPNSWLELQALRSDLQWDGDCFEIAHYGVDPSLFLDADPEPFRQHTGIPGAFVMQAGRIEPGKNQAMLCWALRHTDIPIVLIGGSKHWPSYAELCRSISGSRLTVVEHMPQTLLASAYAAAAVHTLPSWMETCGLVSLEAALSGTPIVGSTFGHELEYLEADAWYADPGDAASIRNAVLAAMEAGRQHHRPIAMKRKVLERFNWERTVDATERLYHRVLERRN